MKRTVLVAARRCLVLAVAAPLAAFAASGEFTFVTGAVTLVKPSGQRSTPVRGTPVDPGDRIETGANGMAQLTMVDQARLSLRPSTQFVIEQYGQQRESSDGAVLSLIKGTLRTFTGLLASTNREKFVMKTRVATVGIRGSGNILYACEGKECDESVSAGAGEGDAITVNHTIEGAHAVTNVLAPSGRPAQQGGAQTVITGPGQTVLVVGGQAPRYVPTPAFIANAATSMTGAKPTDAGAPGSAGGATRDFAPSDTSALPTSVQNPPPLVGNNGLGFPMIDASGNLEADPSRLNDVIVGVGSSEFFGQATRGDLSVDNGELRGYRAYGSGGGVQPAFSGDSSQDFATVGVGSGLVTLGRYSTPSIGFFGPSSTSAVPGSVHWIYGPSGYPTYLSEVLTGQATYTLAAATSPTNQNNTAGSFGNAVLNVDFTARTMGLQATVSIPSASGNAGGSWNMTATGVPLTLNTFSADTSNRLEIVNGSGVSSSGNGNLTGGFEGSLVGTGLAGAILGYGISDQTSSNAQNWNFVTGVAAFRGPTQDGTAPYREGRISDPNETLDSFVVTYSTTNRPDEVVADAQGAASAFSGPYRPLGVHASYSLGSSQVVESGFDPATGMIWGRWAGGVAHVSRNGVTSDIPLQDASLHYIFAGTQSGPVALPLTGSAVYDVIGSTHPTDNAGHVGALNTATLAANFTQRTVDATVNIGINGQTWTGSASNMPIYRDQYFSAYSGTPIAGLPNPAPLLIGCTPACGQGAAGSFDGFFTGRTGEGAGLMYRLGPNQGAIGFGRRGG